MNLTVPEIETSHDEARKFTMVRWGPGRGTPKDRKPGTVLLGWAGWLLALLGAGVLVVSFAGQYTYILNARHQHIPAIIESAMLDLGMIIFTLLALALSRMGKPARTERGLIVACAIGSAGMNYAAADTASFRSVLAFTAAPIFLAIVVDRLVAVIRRHVLADEETSAWTSVGWFLQDAVHVAGVIVLYSLRFALDAKTTGKGLRQVVLNAAPLLELPAKADVRVITDDDDEPIVPPTKKAAFLACYRGHAEYGNRSAAGRVAAELAPLADLQPGTARTYIYDEINRQREMFGSAS